MMIETKNQILKWVGTLLAMPLFFGCAEGAISAGDMAMAERAGGDFGQMGGIDCQFGVTGGCFHGSMECDSLSINEIDGSNVQAVCFDQEYQHRIDGQLTRVVCIESENPNGDPCQICQTQSGETVYDDCMLAPEETGDCETQQQFREGAMVDCEICTDNDGNQISETCRPTDATCVLDIDKGPYLCEQCTDDNGTMVFSKCKLKSIDPVTATVYAGSDWRCSDFYNAEDKLIRHHCIGGDVENEKERLSAFENDTELASDGDPNQGNVGGSGTQGGSDDGASDGSSDGAADGSGDGTDDGTDNEEVAPSSGASEQNCEEVYPDENTRCIQCLDESGDVISEDCEPVDRRINRCERIETRNETCVFCINEVNDLVVQECEPKTCEGDGCEQHCMTGTQTDDDANETFCRFCAIGEGMDEISEVVCMLPQPTLQCEYASNYVYGQAGEETCLVCYEGEGSQVVYQRCEGHAGGMLPKPPVCGFVAGEECQECRDPYFDTVVYSSCTDTEIKESIEQVSNTSLECTAAHAENRVMDALCLRDHCCGAAVLTDESTNTYGADPLCGDTIVLEKEFNSCFRPTSDSTPPTLSSILDETAEGMGADLIAYALLGGMILENGCVTYDVAAMIPASRAEDYRRDGDWE
ncbi:MAG: hypothetical protein CMH56_14140 [Myxococcales bacterium]|nr:hypothetical protein [Myxococcales bacterium]|tara:strand:- start:716 stop:2638 length:1923 start_codon:yes stop_codon:yes gene_type:complete